MNGIDLSYLSVDIFSMPEKMLGTNRGNNSKIKWTDTDADRIPDIVEIYFSNTTNIENETMWQEYLSNTSTGSFFQNYAWCREYYLDLNANNSSAAENWTQKAFNPFVSYNLPPTIVQYNVDIQAVGTSAAKISFWYLVRDVQGIAEIKVDLVECCTNNLLGEYKIILYPNTRPEYNYSGSFVIGTGTLVLVGCELRIKVSNGFNDVSLAKDFDGFGSMFVKALQALGEMLVGGLQKAWEAVENAVNVIVEWINRLVNEILQKVLDPIFNALSGWIEEIIKVFEEVSIGRKQHTSEENLGAKLAMALFSPRMWALGMSLSIAIVSLVTTLNIILKVMSGGADFIVLPILRAFGASLFKFTIIEGILEIALGSISTLLSLFIPNDNPIWNSTLFITIIDIVQSAINYAANYGLYGGVLQYIVKIKPPGLTWMDAIVLPLAFASLIIDWWVSSNGHPHKEIRLGLAVVSVCLSASSFALTLLCDDYIDRFIDGPLAYIEEIICGISTIASSILLGKEIVGG